MAASFSGIVLGCFVKYPDFRLFGNLPWQRVGSLPRVFFVILCITREITIKITDVVYTQAQETLKIIFNNYL